MSPNKYFKLPLDFTSIILILLISILSPLSLAQTKATSATANQSLTLEVFVREGCPHCAKAKAYLPKLSDKYPELIIVLRQVDTDTTARSELMQHAKNAGIWPPGVPTFVIDNRVLVGFDTESNSGPELERFIQHQTNADVIDTAIFGALSVSRLGLPLFTLALGLLDGFNPCAMWVLLFLLSLLVHLHDRKRMAIIAGTFVLVSGLVYFAFMAAWLNVFLLVGLSIYLRLALAFLALIIGIINIKDFITPENGFSLSIPESAKPGLFSRMRNIINADSLLPALTGVISLAIIVNFIELLCTAGIPALYTAILTQQALSPPIYYSYLGLYIIGYIADDTLMVFTAVFALSSQKLSKQTGRWLKLISGLVMLILGLIMVFQPQWLM